MHNISKTLLKHGIEGMISQNEDFFKQNITQALALKLNECVQEIKEETKHKIMFSKFIETDSSAELKEFLDVTKDTTKKSIQLKNGTNINISEENLKDLVCLFESLDTKNRKKMVSEIFNDPKTLKENLNFIQKAKKLL